MDVPGLAISLAFSGSACVGGAWWCLQRLTQLRFLLDTPTSKIRSAAQGYTELYGILRELPQTELRGPLTGKPCVWWRFKIEEQRSDGKRRSWSALESGCSEAWLELADATGECLINPLGAEVRPATREVWSGDLRHPLRARPTGLLMGLLTGGRRYRYTEERLHGVGVKHDALGGGQFGHFHHRENRAGFVIGPHHRDNRHAVIQQRFVFVHVQPAALVHFQLVDDIAFFFQPLAQGEDGRVLDHGGDDGVAVGLGFQRRQDGGGVGFGAAGGEDDFRIMLGAQQGLHLLRARLGATGRDLRIEQAYWERLVGKMTHGGKSSGG